MVLPVGSNISKGVILMTEETLSHGMEVGLDLQDKQDKLTATTARNRKNELRGLIGHEASIYLLSEAIRPLFDVATLTGFENVRIKE
ncbi:MAG: hypothetical protein NTW91_10505 [Verrucomicrobia bacterium]|nr:hypothetical protein [Verrucomicrobiota bacterium]